MDNILKLVLGFLGLAGLVVMMIPSGNPLAPQSNLVVGKELPPAPPSAAPPPSNPPDDSSESDSQFSVQDHDISSFGQPMVDPTPPGQRQSQPTETAPVNGQGGSNASTPQAYPNYGAGIPGYGQPPAYSPGGAGPGQTHEPPNNSGDDQ